MRFVLVGPRPGISPAVYEQFIREHDYPVLPELRTIVPYRIHRTDSASLDPALLPYDYIEQIVVSDLEAYWRDLDTSPRFHRFRHENPKYVERKLDFWAEVVAPSPSPVSRGPEPGVFSTWEAVEEQLIHMIGGRLRLQVGSETREIGPGDVVLIPPDIQHTGEAAGDEPAVYLEVLARTTS